VNVVVAKYHKDSLYLAEILHDFNSNYFYSFSL